MSPAKVMLSPKEQELVTDTGWILTKNAVIHKVYDMFGGLSREYDLLMDQTDVCKDGETAFRLPKIYKGEQYEGMPWVMLDHPRYFTATDNFAIRSFFWWGNFCSITLQLTGSFQLRYAAAIDNYMRANAERAGDWYYSVSEDPWQHHFREANYVPVHTMGARTFASLPIIKLAKKIPLDDWQKIEGFFESNYAELLQMLAER